MPDMSRHAAAGQIRVGDTIGNEPITVLRVDDLARWLGTIENTALDNGPEFAWEFPALEGKREVPKHLLARHERSPPVGSREVDQLGLVS
ncbi:MAG: hypothetical protein AAF081_13345 [Actinomycetota bacterium]